MKCWRKERKGDDINLLRLLDTRIIIAENGLLRGVKLSKFPAIPKRVCGAPLKSKPEVLCTRSAEPGKNRCKAHSDHLKRGVENLQWRTGRYSKSLPSMLGVMYEEAQDDPSLMELRDDVALLDTRINNILAQLSEDTGGARWVSLKTLLKQYNIQVKSKQTDLANATWFELMDLVDEGVQEVETWNEVKSTMEQKRRMVETEQKRLAAMNLVLPIEKVMALVGYVAAIVKENVTDIDALAKIASELDRVVSFPVSQRNLANRLIDTNPVQSVRTPV